MTDHHDQEDCDDESFEFLLQRAKYTLKLLRIAQQNDRLQLQQQRQAEGKPSPTTSSCHRPNPAVEISSMREGSSQSQLYVASETKEQHQLVEEEAEEPKEQQQMEETRTNQPVEEEEEVTTSTQSPKHLQESQRTAMDIFLSSPTAGNWNELVESMRQERDDSSSRRDLMNLIQTITVHNKMDDEYDDDDDDHSSVTMSLTSETPQLSQSQQSLQDTQRTAMESFLSSPTGLNWDDFVKSLGKERDDDIGGRTLENGEETMPVKNATVDVSSRWRQRKFQQQNHNQSGPSRDHCRRLKNNVDEGRRSKGERTLERRIEQILTLTPTATIADTTTCKAAGNVESEMILNDLMTIDEDIALIPKSH